MIAATEGRMPHPAPKTGEDQRAMGIRIIVVDDDEVERFMVVRFFCKHAGLEGVVIQEAESGEEAIRMLEARPFDCIICDDRLGAISGLYVLAFAREQQPAMVRVLFSGYVTPDLETQARLMARPHAILEKPMTPGALERLLQKQVVDRFLRPLIRQRR